MKSCMDCQKINIARKYSQASPLRILIGLPFIYLPIIFLPFFLLSGFFVHIHLRFMGAENLKTLRDFMPDWATHRYTFKTQIVRQKTPTFAFWIRMRVFWFFNCTFYCPFSVAVLEWNAYLVKAVENWWCPFTHEKKENYKNAALDHSHWHAVGEDAQLHPDDRTNPIWNPPNNPEPTKQKKIKIP